MANRKTCGGKNSESEFIAFKRTMIVFADRAADKKRLYQGWKAFFCQREMKNPKYSEQYGSTKHCRIGE